MDQSIWLRNFKTYRVFQWLLLTTLGLLAGCGGSGGQGIINGSSSSSANSLSVGTAQLLESSNIYDAGYTDIASNSSGNAITVWMQDGATGITIWANRYVAGSGWLGAELIDSGTENMLWPRAVIDANGNCTVVWVDNGTHADILARRYDVTNGWQSVTQLETLDGDADNPQIAVDGIGNVVAVWYQSNGSNNRIYANRYVAGNGWSGAQIIDTGSGDANVPTVVADATGNFTAVFVQNDGAYDSVYANRYSAGSGWGTPQLLETTNSSTYQSLISGFSLAAGSDANGDVITAWAQLSNGYYQLHANRYVPGSGWLGDSVVDTSSYDVYVPQVSVNSSGKAMAVWMRDNTASSTYDIVASYWSGSTWSSATVIDSTTTSALLPVVSMDDSGNAIAAWAQFNVSGTAADVYGNRYDATTGWGIARSLETSSNDAWAPHLARSGTNTLAVWEQYDGTVYSIYANTLR